jgi:DNA-binding transcriptional LysR family regulator
MRHKGETVLHFTQIGKAMLEELPTFVAVAAAENFSKVARAQGVAVSSVTRRIDALEAELGVRLFSRSPRRLVLTDAGERLLPQARAILADLANARESVVELSAEPRGVLSVTAPSIFGRRHVVPAVIGFLQRYPLLEVDLHLSDEVVDLAARRVDVAIRMGVLPDSDLVATVLAPLHRVACASPDYITRRGRPQRPIDLLDHDCLTTLASPVPAGWWTFAGVNRGLPLAVKGPFRSGDTDSLLQAAIAGVGVVHLANWLVNEAIVSGQLVSLFPDAPAVAAGPRPAIHAVRMPGRSHTAKAQLFISHLRETFGSPPLWETTEIGAPVM